MIERPHVGVQEHVLGLVQIRPAEPATRCRQAHQEQRHLGRDPGQHDLGFAEVDLALRSQRMMLGNRHVDKRLREETGLPLAMAEDPLSSVVLGAGKMLSDFNLLRKISID